METLNLTIPNMKSPHCQMTVTNTVKAIGGNVKSVSPTRAEQWAYKGCCNPRHSKSRIQCCK